MSNRNVHAHIPSLVEEATSTLRQEVATVIEQILWQADLLSRKQCTHNEQRHWQARGQEQILRRAAQHLSTLLRSCPAIPLLGDALCEYLACLEKCQIDAQEEVHATNPIPRWKASGEIEAWTLLIPLLTHIADACTPPSHATAVDTTEHGPFTSFYSYGQQVSSTSL